MPGARSVRVSLLPSTRQTLRKELGKDQAKRTLASMVDHAASASDDEYGETQNDGGRTRCGIHDNFLDGVSLHRQFVPTSRERLPSLRWGRVTCHRKKTASTDR